MIWEFLLTMYTDIYTMYTDIYKAIMQPVNLEGIGIILNVLAGFMIAPELIGVERLNHFGERVEIELKKFHKKVLVLMNRYGIESPLISSSGDNGRYVGKGVYAIISYQFRILWLHSFIFWVIVAGLLYKYIPFYKYRYIIILSLLVGSIVIAVLLYLLAWKWKVHRYLSFSLYHVSRWYWGVLVASLYLILDLFAIIARESASGLARKGVIKIILPLGISFFIVGSLLEFIALLLY